MTLDDLLDTLKRDILHDRSDAVAGDSDQLWSDTTLIRYIDIAQRRFARRSLCIRDGSSSVTRFSTVAGQADYVLDPSIIAVYSVQSKGNGVWINDVYVAGAYALTSPFAFMPSSNLIVYPDAGDLPRLSHRARAGGTRIDEDVWDVNSVTLRNPGRPLAYETDETMGTDSGSAGVVSMRLYPMPSTLYGSCVMQMRVARMPVIRLTPKTMAAVPEIPEDYHMDMLDYAAYLALRIVDHELGDPQRAAEFQQSFDRHVEEAKLEIERKTFAPQFWGFGQGGFAYSGN